MLISCLLPSAVFVSGDRAVEGRMSVVLVLQNAPVCMIGCGDLRE